MMRHVQPVPGVASGAGPFNVAHCLTSEGGCSAEPTADKPGLFVAPLNTSGSRALAIRQHEYGHLALLQRAILPRHTIEVLTRDGIDNRWIQGGLDVIVNAYMLAQGNIEITTLRIWECDPPSERWLAAVSYLRCEGLAIALTARTQLVALAGFDWNDVTLLARAANTLKHLGRAARPISANQLARLLGDLQDAFGPEKGHATSAPAMPGDDACERAPRARKVEEFVEPGSLEIVRLPLLVSRDGTTRGRKFAAGLTGAFHYPHRALLPVADGRSFGIPRRLTGGTLLVDCSGSMLLSQADVQRALANAPAATVALYASHPQDLGAGRLLVVAAKGHAARINDLRHWLGAGNVVDIPVLEWLNRQPAPRIWISDGQVTGAGDVTGRNLLRDALELKRSGRIQRVVSVDAALARYGITHQLRRR